MVLEQEEEESDTAREDTGIDVLRVRHTWRKRSMMATVMYIVSCRSLNLI